jgi:hypothetical protein
MKKSFKVGNRVRGIRLLDDTVESVSGATGTISVINKGYFYINWDKEFSYLNSGGWCPERFELFQNDENVICRKKG